MSLVLVQYYIVILTQKLTALLSVYQVLFSAVLHSI